MTLCDEGQVLCDSKAGTTIIIDSESSEAEGLKYESCFQSNLTRKLPAIDIDLLILTFMPELQSFF